MVTYANSCYEWHPWQQNFALLPKICNKKLIWLQHYYWRVGIPKVDGITFEMQYTTDIDFTFNETDEFKSWKKWFAWRPVKVKGRWNWLKTVYRREKRKTYSTQDDWTAYQYGDIFDVLK